MCKENENCHKNHENCCCHNHERHECDSEHHEHHGNCCCCHHDEDDENELSGKSLVILSVLFVLGLIVEHFGTKIIPLFNKRNLVLEIVSLVLYFIPYIVAGKPVLIGAVKNIIHGQIFDEQFLMGIASVGALLIGIFTGESQVAEATAIMLLYQIGEHFEDYAVEKSRTTIAEISKLRPEHVLVKNENGEVIMNPQDVKIGSIIVVKPGERIPLDGIVVTGESFLDTSALTGESVPRKVKEGETVLSGSINKQGLLEIQTTKVAGDSALSRILDLVENAAENKTRPEQFVTRFAKIYTPIVCVASLLVAIIPTILHFVIPDVVISGAEVWVYRALMFLVVSCPCAIVVSIPLSFCTGITFAAKRGILIKGSAYLEVLGKTKIAVFDKTGTLTKGNFVVTEVHLSENSDFTEDELLALAAHCEKFSSHPIAISLRESHHCEFCESVSVENIEEFSGKGLSAVVDGKKILAGNSKLMKDFSIQCEENINSEGSVIHIVSDGNYNGYIVISDEIRQDSEKTVSGLKKLGVEKIVMLTGDNKKPAEIVAKKIGVTDVYSELLSGDKLSKVEELLLELNKNGRKKGTLIFTGDGINDAPVLARSDAGVAMGGVGSDAAVEAGDIVIMQDKPSKLLEGIKISRKTVRIVYENLIGSLGIKGIILILSAIGIGNMWIAVFGDVGVTILAVLNSLRLLNCKVKSE